MDVLPTTVPVESDELNSWTTLYKWRWFARENWRRSFRAEVSAYCRAAAGILADFRPRTLHDCSCGLGFKTIVFAEMGYEASGSDPCSYAVDRARELTREEGLRLPFAVGGFADLPECGEDGYDCVHSDHFDSLTDRSQLCSAAKAVHRSLKPGGFFIFGAVRNRTRQELAEGVQATWDELNRFTIFPVCERGGAVLREIHVADRTPQGVLQSRLYLIEENGELRTETAFYLHPAIWTFDDYVHALSDAGFGRILYLPERECDSSSLVFHVAVKEF